MANYTWIGSGDYYLASNWKDSGTFKTPAGPPGPSDGAFIGTDGGAATATGITTSGGLTVAGNSLTVTSGNLSASGSVAVTQGGSVMVAEGDVTTTAIMSVIGASLSVAKGNVSVSSNSSAFDISNGGKVSIGGKLTLNNGDLSSSLDGKSTLTVAGGIVVGAVKTGSFFLTDLYLFNGSLLDTAKSASTIADAGRAEIVLFSGSTYNASGGTVVLGNQKGSDGRLDVHDADTSFTAGSVTVGKDGSGTFLVSGTAHVTGQEKVGVLGSMTVSATGKATVDGDLTMIAHTSSAGRVNVIGGKLAVGGTLDEGAGAAIAVTGGGTVTAAGDVNVGSLSRNTPTATLRVDGDKSTLTSERLFIGKTSAGSLTIVNAGHVTANEDVFVADEADGTVSVSAKDSELDADALLVASRNTAVKGKLAVSSGGQVRILGDLAIAGRTTSESPTAAGEFGIGTVTVANAASNLQAANIIIGGWTPAATNSHGEPNGDCLDWKYEGSGFGSLVISDQGYASADHKLVFADPTFAVVKALNNKANAIRLEVSDTSRLFNFELVAVDGVRGVAGANGLFQIIVVDDKHVDLVGSFFDDDAYGYLGGGVLTGETVTVLSDGMLEVGGHSSSATPGGVALRLDDGGLIEGHGLIVTGARGGAFGSIVDQASGPGFHAMDGRLVIAGNVSGGGNAQIDQNATLELAGAFDGTVTFNGGYETTLKLDHPEQFTGSIAGLVVGDTIDLSFNALQAWSKFGSPSVAHTELQGGQLSITIIDDESGVEHGRASNAVTVTLDVAGDVANGTFTIRNLPNGDTGLTLQYDSAQILTDVPGTGYGSPYVDSLVNGWAKWNVHAGPITYWFGNQAFLDDQMTRHGQKDTLPCDAAVETWTGAQQLAYQQALAAYAAVSGLTFAPATSATTANIVIWLVPRFADDPPDAVTLGQSEFASRTTDGQLWQIFSTAPWKADPDQLAFGGFGLETMVHELGHLLGLVHPHDGGSEADWTTFPGVHRRGASDPKDYVFTETGANGQNQSIFTVMSYVRGWDGQPDAAPMTDDYGHQGALGAFDIAATQALYGANMAYRVGEDHYALPTANQPGTGWSAIWDAGGDNTITNEASTFACIIDLREAPLVGRHAGGYVSLVNGVQGGFTIAHGVTIQNAVGGAGDDLLIGGSDVAVAYTLKGNGGDDIVLGGASDRNTAVFSGFETDYTVEWSAANGGWIVTDKRAGSPDGTDLLINIQDLKFANALSILPLGGPSIAIYPISDDNVLNASETMASLTISGIASVAGQVTVTFNSINYFANTDIGGNWSVTVPVGALTSGVLPDGTYDIKASIQDQVGNAVSAMAELMVDRAAPEVVSVTTIPAVGDLAAGQLVQFIVTMSDKVTVTGKPTLSLSDGLTAAYDAATTAALKDAHKLVFDYTIVLGDKAADLKVVGLDASQSGIRADSAAGWNIRDLSGNVADSSLAKATGLDTGLQIDAPTIVSLTTTASGAVSTGATIKITVATSQGVSVTPDVKNNYPSLALNDGGTATYDLAASKPDAGTLVFDYTVAASDHTASLGVTALTLNGATIVAGANKLDLSKAAGNLGLQVNSLIVKTITTDAPALVLATGQTTKLTLVMNETVTPPAPTPGGVYPALTLSDGATAAYDLAASNPAAGVLVFDYTVGVGDFSPDLQVTGFAVNGATLVDGGGNVAIFGTPAGADTNIKVNVAHIVSIETAGVGNGPLTGGTLTFTVNMSGAVSVAGGTPDLALSNNAAAVYDAAATAQRGGTELVFVYTIRPGDLARDLQIVGFDANGATVKDTLGRAADLTVTSALPGADTNLQIAAATTPTAATILAVSAATDNGETHLNVGHTITITVFTSDAVTVSGAPVLQLNGGKTAAYLAGSGGTALTFGYSVQAGDNFADLQVNGLTGATIVDAFSNKLAGSVAKDLGLVIDTTAPVVAITSTGGTTSKTTQTLSGTAEAGCVVSVLDGTTLLGTAVAQSDGTWRKTILLGGVGAHTLRAEGTDLTGNTGSSNNVVYTLITAVPVASLSPGFVAITEGDSGTTAFTFTVTLDQASANLQSIDWAITGSGDHPASASDFAGGVLPSGTVTFAAGETSRTITVSASGDTTVEFDEFFALTLANPTAGVTLGTAISAGDIQNEDRAHISIAPLSAVKVEGNSGTTAFTFTVSLDQPSVFGTQTADWSVLGTGANPADAADFGGAFPSGGVSFATGETSKTITIQVSGDTATEFNEDFAVTLATLSSGLIAGTATAAGTILNDDSPVVSVTTASVVGFEGNNGTTSFSFTVSLDRAGASGQSVSWEVTGAGLHPADAADFAGILPSGALSFAPGETGKTVLLSVSGDSTIELDEGFTLSLSNPSAGLTLGAAIASGTIQNDDLSVVSIAALAATKPEGNSGTTPFTFTVSLDRPALVNTSVGWSVAGIGAHASEAADFGGALPSGIVSFAIGETSKTITVNVSGDSAVESDEGFVVRLSNPSAGLAIGTISASGTIQNDDSVAVTVTTHDDAYIVQQGQSLSVAASIGVLANDQSATTASLLGNAAHGTLQLVGTGGFSYAPAAGFTGVDSFTYHAANGGSGADGQAFVYVVPVGIGSSTTLNLLALNAEEQIAATYAAFFGRAADAGGFGFWVGQFLQNLPTQGAAALFANIASSFGISAEAKMLYPFLADPFDATDSQISAFLDSVYNNLFNRSSDAGGLTYWTGQIKQTLQAGQFVGSVLVNIMSGAQDTADGKDITTLMGKVAVSIAYVHEQQEHNTVWAGASDIAAATTLVHGVTSDPQSVLVGVKNAEALIASHA